MVERRQRVEREESGLRERAGVGWRRLCRNWTWRRDLRGVVRVGRRETGWALEGGVGGGAVARRRVAVRTWTGTG
jgi:hypothetical protein